MESVFWVLLAGSLLLYLLFGPAFGFAAFRRGNDLSGAVAELTREVARLRKQLDSVQEKLFPESPPQDSAPEAPKAEETPGEAAPPEPIGTSQPAARASSEEHPEAPQEGPATSGKVPPPTAPKAQSAFRLEQWLTTRGLIWLGGITLALAGLFLGKYGYERGWLNLGPGARCVAGFVFGLALTFGGEWLRRRPLQQAIAAIGPNYLPPALTAAGLSSAFASIYAAYGLYDLLAPLVAFVLLALVAFAAFGLAILQGPFIAVLALLGGFVTPLLAGSPEPSAWGLFAYLLALTAAALAVTRYMACWWLAWGALIGNLLWALLWCGAFWAAADAAAMGTFLVVLAGQFLLVRYRAEEAGGEALWPLAAPDRIAAAGAITSAALAFIVVRMDAYGPASLIAVFVLVGLFLAVAWREKVFEGLVIVAALLALAVVAAWHLPVIGEWPPFVHSYRGEGYMVALAPVVPPQLLPFLLVSAAFGMIVAVCGFLALPRARQPVIWAGASAALPVWLLALAYWRVSGLGVDLAWSLAAAALTLLALGAAVALYRNPPRPRDERLATVFGDAANELLLGIYALGGISALGLAFAILLEEAWLTAALSLMLPAIAWVSVRLNLRGLRPAAYIVAGVVLVRLLLNYNVLDYAPGSVPGVNWVLYGYGLPALAFWWSARCFRRHRPETRDDFLLLLLDAGALVFAWLLITFEIRSLVAGDLASRSYELFEQSLQTLAWLALAYGWLKAYRVSGRAVLLWGWRLLAGLAALQSPLLQLLHSNPLWSGAPVGDWPVLNLLALAYLLPALFALAFAWELRADGLRRLAMATAVYALLLVFTYLSLEVRRGFHGPVLSLGPAGDGELMTYSLVWLAYAWTLFGLGLRTGFASLRYAALAVLAVATGKVLLVDWGALDGLMRFTAFAALGFSLLGIPFLYQKLVFPPPSAAQERSGQG